MQALLGDQGPDVEHGLSVSCRPADGRNGAFCSTACRQFSPSLVRNGVSDDSFDVSLHKSVAVTMT